MTEQRDPRAAALANAVMKACLDALRQNNRVLDMERLKALLKAEFGERIDEIERDFQEAEQKRIGADWSEYLVRLWAGEIASSVVLRYLNDGELLRAVEAMLAEAWWEDTEDFEV